VPVLESSVMRAYAWLVVAMRFVVVPAWIAAAIWAAVALPGLNQPGGGALSDLVPEHAKALDAEARQARLFRFPVVSDTQVVQRDPNGMSPAEQARVYGRAKAIADRAYPDLHSIAFALPVTNTLGLFPGARERGTTAVTSLFFDDDYSLETTRRLADAFERRAARRGDDLIGTTGAGPARLEQYDAIQGALPLVAAATIALIALLVGLNFRAVGAPLVVLFAAGIAYVVDVHILGWISERYDISIPKETEPLLLVLLLGIVTDYAIFYLVGHRRRLAAGDRPTEAARAVTTQVTPIVVAAGILVAASAAALLAAKLEFLRAFGPGLALTALVGGLVAVTLVPATLAFFGSSLYWPGLPQPDEDDETARGRRPWRERVAYRATARPAALLIAALAVAGLVAAASGLAQTRLGLGLITGLPSDSEPARAARAAGKGFAPGILSPTVVMLEKPGIARDRQSLARLESELARQPGVAGVLGPRDRPLADQPGVVLSGTGNAARFIVVLEDEPFGAAAVETLDRIETRLPELQRTVGLSGARTSVSGGTALADETISRVVSDLWRVGLIVLLADFLLLALFLRSLVAPLFLLGASLLALGAALGLATYLFQGLLGWGELTYYVPFAAAVLLVALGSDYNVFVTGRIWDEAKKRPFREAIAVATPRAARAITLAGFVLAFSFALLALVPLRAFAEFAFVMCAGVLIDSFLVRSFLVPALMSVFGETASWPGRRLRDERPVRAREAERTA
jgi:RND superfamily putative drug exporter